MNFFCPNFFIPGAAKSGTTTLHELFSAHPDVCMSTVKEPVYWNANNYNTPEKISWYRGLFEQPNASIVGESTTSYMYFDSFITNIKEHFTKAPKFVFILRNPIDRCYSHYWWMVGRGQEKRSFKECVKFDYNREFSEYGYVPDFYYHFGLYGKWLTRFFENFKPETIKIITLEQLTENRIDTLNDCFRFLGLSELSQIPEIKKNKTVNLKYPKLFHFVNKMSSGRYKFTKIGKYFMTREQINTFKLKLKRSKLLGSGKELNYEPLSTEERQWLKNLYSDDVSQLKQLTGKDFSEWSDFKK